jgi:hypothetical protein
MKPTPSSFSKTENGENQPLYETKKDEKEEKGARIEIEKDDEMLTMEDNGERMKLGGIFKPRSTSSLMIPPHVYFEENDVLLIWPKFQNFVFRGEFKDNYNLTIQAICKPFPDFVCQEILQVAENLQDSQDFRKKFSTPIQTEQTFEFDFEINTELSEFRFQPNIFVVYIKRKLRKILQSPEEEFVSFQQ